MKIKIDREDKLDVIVGNRVFKKDSLYRVVSGEDANHAYYLKKIYKVDRDWMLKLGEYDYDAEIRSKDLEVADIKDYRKCDCAFTCEGYVLKSFTWI